MVENHTNQQTYLSLDLHLLDDRDLVHKLARLLNLVDIIVNLL